ncbi:MAG: hypothetical protein COB23_06520 [Methylophaga sp.]|nr:MAG: hypothetical protein COB23_06520 [Methylophaga sp.]
MKISNILASAFFGIVILATGVSFADVPQTVDGVTTIHLEEYNGYFSAEETLAGLKPGTYEFIVENKSNKLVGFWLQDAVTHELLEKTSIEVGETIKTRVTITDNGFRYRCPINPTPWYEVGVSK